MGPAEITAFLTALAVQQSVSASTQNQALSALLFLYREVLGCDPGWLDGIVRARRPRRLPVVLTRAEVGELLGGLAGVHWLMAMLMYGAGLRLRVKDLDFERGEIVVREGKGTRTA
ncbi:phage integrase N-terminal SAM-like domain-containing protein [Candidatus Binatia bacterium]|nr:phage integrase N-terminal SAM-like domain-containing protein [Candidatus Binatia bacterium]